MEKQEVLREAYHCLRFLGDRIPVAKLQTGQKAHDTTTRYVFAHYRSLFQHNRSNVRSVVFQWNQGKEIIRSSALKEAGCIWCFLGFYFKEAAKAEIERSRHHKLRIGLDFERLHGRPRLWKMGFRAQSVSRTDQTCYVHGR